MIKKKATPLLIGLFITVFFAVGAIVKILPLEQFELKLYDIRYKIRGKTTPPENVVIVAIDDKSIEKIGRWPWDRSKIAFIIDSLKKMGAKVIALDIIFSEPSKDDGVLRDSIKAAGNVILPVVFQFGDEKKNVQDEALFPSAPAAFSSP
jgi:adenylate cyclase